jgi:hypothetical protein
MIWFLAALGVVVAYTSWYVLLSTWSRLQELGIENTKSSSNYFDCLFYGGILGLIFSRVTWMVSHRGLYSDVPWGLLPYNRNASETVWLAVFPWRFFRIAEGIYFPVFWLIAGVFVLWILFVPALRLIRRLKLEKRGIMRAFLIRVLLCGLLVGGYFSLLLYFSL